MRLMTKKQSIEERAAELALEVSSAAGDPYGVTGISTKELQGWRHALEGSLVEFPEDHMFASPKREREYWAGYLAACIHDHDPEESLPAEEQDDAPVHSHGDGVPCTESHVDSNPHHGGGMAGHDTWWDEDGPEPSKLDQEQGP